MVMLGMLVRQRRVLRHVRMGVVGNASAVGVHRIAWRRGSSRACENMMLVRRTTPCIVMVLKFVVDCGRGLRGWAVVHRRLGASDSARVERSRRQTVRRNAGVLLQMDKQRVTTKI